MLVRVNGATLNGIDGAVVLVEVDAGRGLPAFHIVGQGDRVVNESRDRIRAAFRQSGLEFPPGRVTVNLAPTELPKAGSSLDLAIALGIAATRIELPEPKLARTLLLGELGLDGVLRPVRGTLAMMAAGQAAGLVEAVTPYGNLEEAGVCPAIRAWGAHDLGAVLRFLSLNEPLREARPPAPCGPEEPEFDLADVRGQEMAKRALEIAAAGVHNVLLLGPPGGGKTLLARRLPGLLPDLALDEALEATRIHSVAGTLGDRSLLMRPPLRAPHHTTSDVAMTGGGRPLRPGELSLAHRGVLFLDEIAEFRRPVLEALRQPLEEGVVRVARAHGAAQLPTRFQLVAAMNPCPCGYRDDASRECSCDDSQVRRYRGKLSGPLLDRIDLRVPVPAVPWQRIIGSPPPRESTLEARTRVIRARNKQRARYRQTPHRSNSEIPGQDLRLYCPLSTEAARLLERSAAKLEMSVRAHVRVLRVARTIADLEGASTIAANHVAEALSYRGLE
jgi:magnesium chelatase family protein